MTVQDASRSNSRDAFDAFVKSAIESSRHCTLRGQLEFVTDDGVQPVSVDEVESAASIVKRFCTGQYSVLELVCGGHSSVVVDFSLSLCVYQQCPVTK